MDRRALLCGASAVAISAALPAAPALPGYLRLVVDEWGCDGMVPAIPSKADMDAWFARWSDLTNLYASCPGMEIAHLTPIPVGVTDWRQATAAEIIDDMADAFLTTRPAIRTRMLPNTGLGREGTGTPALNRGLI